MENLTSFILYSAPVVVAACIAWRFVAFSTLSRFVVMLIAGGFMCLAAVAAFSGHTECPSDKWSRKPDSWQAQALSVIDCDSR